MPPWRFMFHFSCCRRCCYASSPRCLSSCFLLALAGIPNESDRVQSIDPFLGDVRSLPKLEQPILPPLAFHPDGQRRMLLVAGRDDARSGPGLVLLHFRESLLPQRVVGIPDEPDVVQRLLSAVREGGVTPFQLELELVALPLDPLGEGDVVAVGVRDRAVAVLLAVRHELVEAQTPLRLLVALDLVRLVRFHRALGGVHGELDATALGLGLGAKLGFQGWRDRGAF
mmetsp:Transcript_16798/g.47090  ORF Transcript_16798/g.47090 Transcript_16798/m.47090 type:complete len:227 (-) Transcript_16798:1034-1714(-)